MSDARVVTLPVPFSKHGPKCYACDAILDRVGPGEVPLCLKCRGRDGEKTPTYADAFAPCLDSPLLGVIERDLDACLAAIGVGIASAAHAAYNDPGVLESYYAARRRHVGDLEELGDGSEDED